MTDDIPRRYDRVEVITGVQRRRRWTPEEKIQIVEETYLPGMGVSLVARKHGIAGNQLSTWRRLMAQDALTAATTGGEVVAASEYRALKTLITAAQGTGRPEGPARSRHRDCAASPVGVGRGQFPADCSIDLLTPGDACDHANDAKD